MANSHTYKFVSHFVKAIPLNDSNCDSWDLVTQIVQYVIVKCYHIYIVHYYNMHMSIKHQLITY